MINSNCLVSKFCLTNSARLRQVVAQALHWRNQKPQNQEASQETSIDQCVLESTTARRKFLRASWILLFFSWQRELHQKPVTDLRASWIFLKNGGILEGEQNTHVSTRERDRRRRKSKNLRDRKSKEGKKVERCHLQLIRNEGRDLVGDP